MRELKRSMAKANMRAAGISRLFKKRRWGKSDAGKQSAFARNWREWVYGPPKKRRKKAKAA